MALNSTTPPNQMHAKMTFEAPSHPVAQQHAEIQAEGSLCYESETKSLAASSIDDGMKSARSPVIDPFKVGITEKFEGIDGILDSDVVLRAPFDSYADYIATREEYDMQHHEWVSSFYGNCMNARMPVEASSYAMAQEYAEVNSIQTNDSPGNGAETKYFDLSLFDEWMDDVQSPFYDLVGMAMPKSGQETPEIMEPRAVRETPLNSYADYVATEGEYDVHPYEWASNFYAFSDAMASKNADTNFIQTKDGLGYDSDNESVTMSVFDEWIKTPHSPAGHLYTEGDNEEDGLLGYGPTNHPFVQAAHPSSNPAYFSDGQDVRPGAGHGQYAGTPDSDVTVTEKSMQRGEMTKNARATKQPKGTDQIRISPDSEVDTDLEYLSAWGSPKDKPDGCPACGYISEDRNGAATPPYIFDVLTPGKIDEMGSGTWTFFPEFTRHSFNMEEELSTPRAVTFISRPQELNGSPVSIHSSENREAMGDSSKRNEQLAIIKSETPSTSKRKQGIHCLGKTTEKKPRLS